MSLRTIPLHAATQGGLYQRYAVTKTDGSHDPEAMYFVLRIDHKGDDIEHLRACHEAALVFCEHTPNRLIASELKAIIAQQAGMLQARAISEDV